MVWFVLVTPVYNLVSFWIATWAENNKRIGFWWAFFFGLTLTPAIAYIIAWLSGTRNERRKKGLFKDFLLTALPTLTLHYAIILLIIGLYSIESVGWFYLVAATGMAGLSLYFYKRVLSAN